MRITTRKGIAYILLAGMVAACDNSLTQPSLRDADDIGAASDRTRPTPTRPARPEPKRPERPDTATRRPCRPDHELTPEQIATIRALYGAYENEIADDLRFIAKVEQEARAAAAAGASRDEIRAILARADDAKQHLAEATQRLRAAIAEILRDDRTPCSIVTDPAPVKR